MAERPLGFPFYRGSMDICFSHVTGLQLLRWWSEKNPFTLECFHNLVPNSENDILPLRRTSFSVSRAVARTERELAWALEQIDDSALREELASLLAGTASVPCHVLVPSCPGQHCTQRVVFHQVPRMLPEGSLVELMPGVLCASPELVFVQMAEVLGLGGLVALGYELCGGYPLDGRIPQVRSPLTTPLRLATFAHQVERLRGLRLARVAARFVQAKSASAMETEVSALATVSMKWGGFGLPPARLNERISLSPAAARVARSDTLVLDAYWPAGNIALEYDGRESHGSEWGRVRDSRRRDALTVEGISLVTLTAQQFSVYQEFEEVIAFIRKRLGMRSARKLRGFPEAHSGLRYQLRRFHQERY